MTCNVKNAPADYEYLTEHGYSQSYPWAIVDRSKSGKTLTLAAVEVRPDPDWKDRMEWYIGGFAGHCANQHQQTWLFDNIDTVNTITVRASRKRPGQYARIGGGAFFVPSPDGPRYFYDYNF